MKKFNLKRIAFGATVTGLSLFAARGIYRHVRFGKKVSDIHPVRENMRFSHDVLQDCNSVSQTDDYMNWNEIPMEVKRLKKKN